MVCLRVNAERMFSKNASLLFMDAGTGVTAPRGREKKYIFRCRTKFEILRTDRRRRERSAGARAHFPTERRGLLVLQR